MTLGVDSLLLCKEFFPKMLDLYKKLKIFIQSNFQKKSDR